MSSFPRLTATFRPQEILTNGTVIDSGTPVVFDATDALLSRTLEEIRTFQNHDYDSDSLADDLDHPHNGPFEVDVDLSAWLVANGLSGETLALTEADLGMLRARFAKSDLA